MRLVLVFILEMNNQCLPKFVQTDSASSSVKRAILLAMKSGKLLQSLNQHSSCRIKNNDCNILWLYNEYPIVGKLNETQKILCLLPIDCCSLSACHPCCSCVDLFGVLHCLHEQQRDATF